MPTLNNAIELLKAELAKNPNATKAKLKGFLAYNDFTSKIINEAIEAVCPTAPRKQGFREDYYDFLVNNPLATKAETEAFILTHPLATGNVIKHVKAFLRDYDLVQRVRGELASSKEEDTRSEEHKQAYRTYEDIKAKNESGHIFTKAEASKAHPDKVEQFNDAKLTEMYNELYKSLNIKTRQRRAA